MNHNINYHPSSFKRQVRHWSRMGLLSLTLLLSWTVLQAQDTTPPSTVPNFVGKIGGQNINGMTVTTLTPTINFTWSPATDASGIDRYQLVLQPSGGPWLYSPHVLSGTSYNMNTTLVDGITYTTHIRARDNAGNWGSFILGASFTVDLNGGQDITPPSTVPNFSAKIGGQNLDGMVLTSLNQTINYTWNHATDAGGIERYHIIVNHEGVGWVEGPNILYPGTSYNLNTTLVDGASYKTYIRAKDNAGNWGQFVLGASFTVDLNAGQDVTPPSTVPNFSAKIGGQNLDGMVLTSLNQTINYTWNHATDAGGIERYHIIVNHEGVGWVEGPNILYPGTSYNLNTTLVDGGVYKTYIRAKDNAGNWGQFVLGASFTVDLNGGPDITPPSTVPNFVGRIGGQVINGMTVTTLTPTINFTWNHATDASGIDRYQIVLQPSGGPWLLSPVVLYPNTSYDMTPTLIDGLTYTTHIRARDNAGNWGSFILGASFTVDVGTGPDVTPPSTVPNFLARIGGQNVDGMVLTSLNQTINYTWNHATDPSGIERYHIVLSHEGVGWVEGPNILFPGTSYNLNTTLVDGGTYKTYIRAKDNAGNWGSFILGGTFTVDLGSTGGNLQLWSSPSTWGGNIPGPSDSVVIPQGKRVLLDIDANVRSLTIHGELIAKVDEDLNLSSHYILVAGGQALFQWGTPANRYQGEGVITLKHDNSITVPGMGTKFLGAMNQGTVEIHGQERLSWTQLSSTAAAGATSLSLVDNVSSWKAGDEIVIASTDFDAAQAETRVLTSAGGNSVSFSGGLNYMHYGSLQTYKNGSLTLDERAEVGLLSRNIRIQGDGQSASTGVGGHCMFHNGTTVHFSGVELYHMGQRGELGRYPFHWHLAGNVSGQYIKNSSIHRSFNRVTTVHGTNYALVEDNVGYDHIGHGYFLENGTERFNTFRHNLGLLTRAPAPGQAVVPHDDVIDPPPGGRNLRKLPATFWITNPDNSFIDNACGGSEGSGFWMVVAPGADGQRNLRAFTGNTSHSTQFSNFTIDGSIDGSGNLVYGHYRPRISNNVQAIPIVSNFTGYKCRERNVWIRANTMRFLNCSLADSPRNTFFAFNQILENSLLVGKSGNVGRITSSHETTAGRSLPFPNQPGSYEWNVFSGHTIYDGPTGLSNVHFAGFSGNNSTAFNTNAAAQKSPVHWVQGLTFENNVPFADKVAFGKASTAETMYSGGVMDLDGSLTGQAGIHLFPQITAQTVNDNRVRQDGFSIEPGASLVPQWDAYECPNEKYGLHRNFHDWSTTDGIKHYNLRSDGFATYGHLLFGHTMNPVIVNKAYEYGTQYHRIPNRTKSYLMFVDSGDELVSVYPNMPSSTYVYDANNNPLSRATSLNNLRNSSTQKYYLENNTLYLKHVAVTGYKDWRWQYGSQRSGLSPEIRICKNQNCTDPAGYSDLIRFADFERGFDTRITPGATVGGTPNVQSDVTNPNVSDRDGINNRIYWNITTDGDGQDEYSQVRFDFERQVWTDFNYLYVDFRGEQFEVLIHDINQGWLTLGPFNPGANVKIPLNVSTNRSKLDEVDRLIIRVKESFLGSVNTSGLTATLDLYDITLSRLDFGGKSGRSAKMASEIPSSSDFALYPNPSSTSATVEVEIEGNGETGYLKVMDAKGTVVANISESVQAGTWKKVIDKSSLGLSAGMYNVVVRIGNQAPISKTLIFQ